MRKTFALMMLLALVLTACAGAAADEDDDPVDETPPAVGACAEENPDCVDVGVGEGDQARCVQDAVNCDDTPGQPLEEEPASASGSVTELGGLTVSEALATDATGILIVKGHLFADASGVRLCEGLAKSFPPQCGGTSIEVSALTTLEVMTTSEGDVRWSDQVVTVVGEIVDGVLVADETSNG